MLSDLAHRALPVLVAFVVLIAVWELISLGYSYVLPHPWTVALTLFHHPWRFLSGAGTSLREALSGLAIGCSVAIVLALLMARFDFLARAVLPLAVALNVTPFVALVPALLISFGFGSVPKVAIAAILCFFPTLISASAGLRSADRGLVEVLQTLDASPWEILLRVRLPSSLPYLMAIARVVLPLSIVGAVVAEILTPGSTRGLGTLIYQAEEVSDLAQIYAAIVCLCILGVAFLWLISLAEKRLPFLSLTPGRTP